jgi:hypothetical protein
VTRLSTSALVAPLLAALALGTAVPVTAAGAHYRAQPASAPAAARVIVRDLVWKCGDGGCTSGKSNSRPSIDCSALVRKIGAVQSFSVQGQAFTPAELEKCNARVK